MPGQLHEIPEQPSDQAAVASAPAAFPSKQGRGGELRSGSWLSWIVSDDPPGRLLLNAIMLLILAAFVFAPFLFPGAKALGVASRICIFVILVASYDLLLGYTGIVSFAHTMFFGIGAYGAAIPLASGWVGWDALAVGTFCAVALSLALAVVIGLLSLRVQAIFFSMITLAVASFAQLLATQLRAVTGGEDGL